MSTPTCTWTSTDPCVWDDTRRGNSKSSIHMLSSTETYNSNYIMNDLNDKYPTIQLHNNTYEVQDVIGDGACFYNSLCKDEYFSEYNPISLRQEYLRRLKHQYMIETRLQKVWKGICKKQIAAYCDDHANLTNRGSEKEAALISYMFDVNIRIVVREDSSGNPFKVNYEGLRLMKNLELIKPDDPTERKTITLLYHQYMSPMKPCKQKLRNHFLYLHPVGKEQEIHASSFGGMVDMSSFVDTDEDELDDGLMITSLKEEEDKKISGIEKSHNVTSLSAHPKKYRSRSVLEWYHYAKMFHTIKQQNRCFTQREFLSDSMSGTLTMRDTSAFSRWYKKYLNGDLDSARQNSKRTFKFDLCALDKAVMKYISSKPISLNTYGKQRHPTWKKMKSITEKAWKKLHRTKRNETKRFTVSVGFLSNVLKRNRVNLGEP